MTHTSGTFGTYIGELKRAGLIVVGHGMVKADLHMRVFHRSALFINRLHLQLKGNGQAQVPAKKRAIHDPRISRIAAYGKVQGPSGRPGQRKAPVTARGYGGVKYAETGTAAHGACPYLHALHRIAR